ncbi:MAG: 50S ribosomal protein L23 [Candidatus Aenigmarchaeota archaeon]|nr:50S ribosomal protein L23 [Candidatus Aenigmarchaeota archaeon]
MIDKGIEKQKKEDKSKEQKKEKNSKGKEPDYNPWNVLSHPSMTEKSMNMVEMGNTLVFIVDKNSKKPIIKEAVEKGFNVKVLKVNLLKTMKGDKKAYVKLHPDHEAADIASRMGML